MESQPPQYGLLYCSFYSRLIYCPLLILQSFLTKAYLLRWRIIICSTHILLGGGTWNFAIVLLQ